MKTITITLDEYEVANIRELLKCCGFDGTGGCSVGAPFPYNTGDWLGQLWWKLEPMQTDYTPNRSLSDVRVDLANAEPQGAPCVHSIHVLLGHCTRCGARPNDTAKGAPRKPEGE